MLAGVSEKRESQADFAAAVTASFDRLMPGLVQRLSSPRPEQEQAKHSDILHLPPCGRNAMVLSGFQPIPAHFNTRLPVSCPAFIQMQLSAKKVVLRKAAKIIFVAQS